MNLWTGTLAHLETRSTDGRILVRPERLHTRALPLPLLNGLGDRTPIGSITHLSIHGDQLRAEGTIRTGLLQPGQHMPAAIDLDGITADPAAGWDTDNTVRFTTWRVTGATIHPYLTPAFPDAHIRLKEPQ